MTTWCFDTRPLSSSPGWEPRPRKESAKNSGHYQPGPIEINAAIEKQIAKALDEKVLGDISITILHKKTDNDRYRFYGVRAEKQYYPACVMKLACLPGISAVVREYPEIETEEFLEWMALSYGPSDTEPFSEIIDAVTETQNWHSANPDQERFADFEMRRLFFERYLADLGLLEGQRILNKVYPTETSNSPRGAEYRLLLKHGGNLMSTYASAKLMLSIAEGDCLLEHRQWMSKWLVKHPQKDPTIMFNVFSDDVKVQSKNGDGFGYYCETAYVEKGEEKYVISFFSLPGEAPLSDGLQLRIYCADIIGNCIQQLTQY